MVDAIATVNETGKNWVIAMVNRHPEKAVACTIKMKDRLLEGEYSAVRLAGDSPDSFNDTENPNRVVPKQIALTVVNGSMSLPPHSLTLIKVLTK